MKIAYINADSDVPVFGTKGCSVHVQEVLLAMLRRGDEVHIFTTRVGDETPHETTGLTVHLLPGLPRADLPTRERFALAANETLRVMLEKESEKGAFDFIYERYSLWSCGGMEFASERNLKSILEVNAPLIEEQTASRMLVNRGAAEEVAMRAFRSATIITAVSRQLAHILEQHPTARGRVYTIPNAVSPERFHSIEPEFPKDGSFVIGFVGTLKAGHGLSTLIESFAKTIGEIPEARLLIVGHGPEKEQLDRDIGARDLGARVRFTGAIPPESVPEMLASMDVAVAPYPALSQFYLSPLKLYEYMAAGLPIVASRIGQIEEVIQHGKTGMLVPPGDATAMAHSVVELYRQPQLRGLLGAAAQAAVQEHTWDNAVAAIFSLAGVSGQ